MNADTTLAQDRFDRRKPRTEAPASGSPSEAPESHRRLATGMIPECLPDDALARIRQEIREEYAELHRKPWIVGYSAARTAHSSRTLSSTT